MEKTLAPLTQLLKKNSKMVTLVLLVLVVALLFPLRHFTSYDVKNRVESELRRAVGTPWAMVLVSVLILSIHYSGDLNMLVLFLYLLHHILMH